MTHILILGGYGFLGTNVMKYVDTYLRGQYKFIVFDKFEEHLNGVKFDNIERVYAGDFTDRSVLEKIFNENTIDIVLHSLSTTVPVSSNNARYDVESNLLPTLDILELMVKHNIKKIIYLSSGGAIYGTKSDFKYKETDDVYPVSSYGVVKLAIEKYLMQFSQLYGLQPLILRLSNPYGPYHYSMKQGIVNISIIKALRKEEIEIWGEGNDKKDYIYVDDYVRILFNLIENNVYNEILNVASGQILSVNEIINTLNQYIPDIKTKYVIAQKFDASHFELDTTKLLKILPNFEFTPFKDGLEKTYKWTLSSNY